MEYWNPKVERLPAEELKQLQGRKLRQSVENAYEYSSFYKKRFAAAGVSPHDIRSLEDIQQLPFTHKTDLRDTYPTGMFSVPQSQIVRFHVSSGTTGVPTVVGYTADDIDVWTTCLARSLTACGLGPATSSKSRTATDSSQEDLAFTTASRRLAQPSSP